MIKGLLNIIGAIGIAGSGTGLVIPSNNAAYQKSAAGQKIIQDIKTIYNASNFGMSSLRSVQFARHIKDTSNPAFRITGTDITALPIVHGQETYLVTEKVINALYVPFSVFFAVQMSPTGALQVVSDQGVPYRGFALSVHGSVHATLDAFGHDLQEFKFLFNLAIKQPSWTMQIKGLTSQDPVIRKVMTIGKNSYYNIVIDYKMGTAVFETDFNCYFDASTYQIIFPEEFPV